MGAATSRPMAEVLCEHDRPRLSAQACALWPPRQRKSCFWHDVLNLFLVVYVDDFKLAGPATAIKKGWELIRRGVKTDDPGPLGMYFGCRHDVSERKLPDIGTRVRAIEYNMDDFLRSCVERYKELTGVTTMSRAATPFIQEISEPDFTPTPRRLQG